MSTRNAALLAAMRELDKIAQRAVSRIDAVVIGNIVSIIPARGRLKRHQPDGCDAHALEIIQPAHQALKVADSIAIRIHVGGDRQTVDDRVLVPKIIDHEVGSI